jgi:hypothetical protein
MLHQGPSQPVGDLVTVGDLVFAQVCQYHRFGRVIEVTATHVTYRSIPTEREISVPADSSAFWNVTDRGRCVVVQKPR